MVGVFGETERSELELCRRRRLELEPEPNRTGEQQPLEGVKEEFPPQQPDWSVSANQQEPELPYIKEEVEEVCIKEEEADVTAVTVKSEEDGVDLLGFDQSFKEENGEDNRAPEPARTSGSEEEFGPDQQQLLEMKQQFKTPSLDQEEPESCDFKVKEEADVVAVKSEENEEVAESSQLHHSVTEGRENCGEPGMGRNFGPGEHLGPGHRPLLVIEEECSSQQQLRTPSLDQEEEEPESCDFKEKEEFDFVVAETSGKNQQNAVCSVIHGSVTENREDGGGPERVRNSASGGLLGPCTKDETHSSVTEVAENVWKETSISHSQSTHNRGMGSKTCDKLSCPEHREACAYRSHLLGNVNIDFVQKTFDCSECGKRFTRSSNLRTHKRLHGGERPFSCFECGKTFTCKSHLKSHLKIHTGEKPFSCSECDKRFTDKTNLRNHVKIHTGEKPFSCFVCEKRFTQKNELKSHEKIHTGEKPFSCFTCGKRFAHKTNLRTHEIIHTGEKPFSCSQCGKKFTHKSHLNSHERIHTGEKPFMCSECGKTFTQKTELKSHEKIHTGEKPFSCSICGKQFAHKTNLKTHEIIHTGEKPFNCSQCDKKFTHKSHLNSHERIHTGEKPFICSVCGKKFTQNCNLRAHEKIHTGEKPFSCSECGKRFTQKTHLNIHIKTHTK